MSTTEVQLAAVPVGREVFSDMPVKTIVNKQHVVMDAVEDIVFGSVSSFYCDSRGQECTADMTEDRRHGWQTHRVSLRYDQGPSSIATRPPTSSIQRSH